ncbi:Lupeol synthase [Stylosanthes scabra]|uniref:Terpene cyclase/mutase family member n=1 Tax=Stylosanthes scabra TaxID=79078 RepID=A0ABU6ZR09_9FABA|nr:Lupeol synthase [Stylosanthes scabra]
MFGSGLSYVALRILGEGLEDGEDMAMARARKWILDHGSLLAIPSWGKFWVTVLGVYEWSGCNPLPPELWLLPRSTPFHPGNIMPYCRLVYMAMSYVYGKKFVGPITALIKSIRQELYNEPYDQINWNKARNNIAKEDLYFPHPIMQDVLWGFLYHIGEPLLKCWPFTKLREKALESAINYVLYDSENTKYLSFGVVDKVLCMLACWIEDSNSKAAKHHLARVPDFFWIAEDGLKLQGVGAQAWNANFAIQAILACNINEEYGATLKKAHDFIKASQIRENPSGDYVAMFRQVTKGAWTISIADEGLTVSDCTAEGLKVTLLLLKMPTSLVGEPMETERFYDAVNVVLSLQNISGGFSAWESRKAYNWLEKFNPTEFFEDCLTEKDYVECTSSAVQALVLFRKLYPNHRREEIDNCISKAIQYIEDTQNPDGSWYGCWAVCYTYGTWFAVEALKAVGKNYHNSPSIRKACQFLLSKQLPNGGWGESYLSSQNKIVAKGSAHNPQGREFESHCRCEDLVGRRSVSAHRAMGPVLALIYTNLEGNRANTIQTSWALLTLIAAGQDEIDATPIHRGMKIIINSQMEDGDFPEQDTVGVYFRNCTLTYASFRNIFPIWALGEYHRRVLHHS